MRLFLAAVLLSTGFNGPHALAQGDPRAICDAKDPRENFTCSLLGSHLTCKIFAETALLNGDWTRVWTCQKEYQPAVHAAFEKARTSLRKKPAAQAEAKEAYAQWMTTLDGLSPKSGEAKAAYRRRTADLEDQLTQRISKFKVESDLP